MGYAEYFRQLLRPLRLYDLTHGAGAAELDALGGRFDAVHAALETALREALLPTAEDEGLRRYEAVLPYVPAAVTLQGRREAVMALLRVDGSRFTQAGLNDTLAGCGIGAAVEETEVPRTVRVTFPGTRGVPEGLEALRTRIEAILPCHLGAVYAFVFVTWAELEARLPTWDALEAACPTWRALEALS